MLKQLTVALSALEKPADIAHQIPYTVIAFVVVDTSGALKTTR